MGTPGEQHIDFTQINAAQLGHNYLNPLKGGKYTVEELNTLNGYLSYVLDQKNRDLKKYKVGLMFVCVNQPYWQYIKPVVEDAKQLFLPGHDVEIMVWSDMPNYPEGKGITYGTTMFPIESAPWPYPTLMRYHFFLQEEEYLKKFDYLFYLDLDMRIVNVVGDEILGDGLTAAEHPMYSFRPGLRFPLEPNPQSSAYIKVPKNYFAGGIQGGKAQHFIDAMHGMKKTIDKDFSNNYIAIWNDESHWNRYLVDHPPVIILNPSYVYPDSMINEYYKPIWGRDYPPKIYTLTKPFSVSKEGGAAARDMVDGMKPLQL